MAEYAVTPTRVGGWRGKLLRRWIGEFQAGKVDVDTFEQKVEATVRVTEPEALAQMAKQAAADADAARERARLAEEAAHRARGRAVLVAALKRILDLDATPYLDTLDGYYNQWHVTIGGVRYSVGDTRYRGKQVQCIQVTRQCPTCWQQIGGGDQVTDLATLGKGLARLEGAKHCGSLRCRWKEQGKTDDEIAALEREQEARTPSAWVERNVPGFTRPYGVLWSGGYYPIAPVITEAGEPSTRERLGL